MKKREDGKKAWEAPSLEWIHRVRRQRKADRAGKVLRPLSSKEAEKLVKKYGLKLARPSEVGR